MRKKTVQELNDQIYRIDKMFKDGYGSTNMLRRAYRTHDRYMTNLSRLNNRRGGGYYLNPSQSFTRKEYTGLALAKG